LVKVKQIIKPPWWTDDTTQISKKINIPSPNDISIKHNILGWTVYSNITCMQNRYKKKSKLKLLNNPVNDDVANKLICQKKLEEYETELKKVNLNKKIITKLKTQITTTKTKIDDFQTVTIQKQYRLKLDDQQKIIIQKWMRECIKLYNYCVNKYNNQGENDENYLDFSCYTKIKKRIFDDIYKDKNKDAPFDMLTDEVRSFCSNLKSAKENNKQGHNKHFTMKEKNINELKTLSIMIPKASITKVGIFPRFLGKIKGMHMNSINYEKVCDSRLVYSCKTKEYVLKAVMKKKRKIVNEREKIVGLDPGVNMFLAFHGVETYGFIGKYVHVMINKNIKKIRELEEAIRTKKNKKTGDKIKRIKNLKTKIDKLWNKTKNIIKEIHNKSALFLCKNYEKILIPEFQTQNMLQKDSLNGETKDAMTLLSHYKFRQHLIQKSIEYGCKVETVTEEYTSQTCTKCGEMSKNYVNREKRCNCGYKINRDINGARNVLLKILFQ